MEEVPPSHRRTAIPKDVLSQEQSSPAAGKETKPMTPLQPPTRLVHANTKAQLPFPADEHPLTAEPEEGRGCSQLMVKAYPQAVAFVTCRGSHESHPALHTTPRAFFCKLPNCGGPGSYSPGCQPHGWELAGEGGTLEQSGLCHQGDGPQKPSWGTQVL